MTEVIDSKRILDMSAEIMATLRKNHMDECTEVLQVSSKGIESSQCSQIR